MNDPISPPTRRPKKLFRVEVGLRSALTYDEMQAFWHERLKAYGGTHDQKDHVGTEYNPLRSVYIISGLATPPEAHP